jgi:short-subunit dehydrogenase
MGGLKISHHFFSLWKKNGRRGAINFTASSVGYFVAPYSSMYGATKSFMINFASSLAVEGKHNNIDILCFNPQVRLHFTNL